MKLPPAKSAQIRIRHLSNSVHTCTEHVENLSSITHSRELSPVGARRGTYSG